MASGSELDGNEPTTEETGEISLYSNFNNDIQDASSQSSLTPSDAEISPNPDIDNGSQDTSSQATSTHSDVDLSNIVEKAEEILATFSSLNRSLGELGNVLREVETKVKALKDFEKDHDSVTDL